MQQPVGRRKTSGPPGLSGMIRAARPCSPFPPNRVERGRVRNTTARCLCRSPTDAPRQKRLPHEEGVAVPHGVPYGTAKLSANGAADTHDRPHSLPFHRPVDGRASNPELVGQLSGAVLAVLE